MNRKLLSLFLAIVLFVSLLPAGMLTALAAPAEAQTKAPSDMSTPTTPNIEQPEGSKIFDYPVPGGNIRFNLTTGTIFNYEGAPTKIDIPEKINGVKVVAIGRAAFWDCISLTEVHLPNGVTTICEDAFANCRELTAITLPNSLKTIGNTAFELCGSLSGITIPNGVTTIGEHAFSHCWVLERVEIPASVTTIGSGAFSYCEMLEAIWVDENNPHYCSNNGVLFSKDKTELLAYPSALAGSYTIPNGVVTIGDSAFDGCYNLTAIALPNGVTAIGEDAFSGCQALTDITLPDSITAIGDYAFLDCYALSDITLPNKLKAIGSYAFGNCNGLSSIIIPNSVTAVGAFAFYSCWGLQCVEIPANVTTIGTGAFSSCPALEGIWIDENNPNYCSDENGILFNKNKTELLAYPATLSDIYIVPDGVTTICDYAFYNCDNLTVIDFPNSLTAIGDSAFFDCSNLTVISFPNSLKTIGNHAFECTNLSRLTIPNGVTTIGDYAFADCWTLESIAFPDSLTTIGDYAFSWCESLTDITFPSSLKVIGNNAFEHCYSLRQLTIPNGVETIGANAFNDCDVLECVEISASITSIGSGAFNGCEMLEAIYVDEDNSYYCSDNGILFSKDKTELLTYPVALAESYIIPDGVTTIGDHAFADCWALEHIAFPDSLTSIGDSAFRDCYSLTNIALPDRLQSIGNNAFSGCDGLSFLTIPDGVTTIGYEAFGFCWDLGSIAIPGSITDAGYDVFIGCDLSDIYYGSSPEQWDQSLNAYNNFIGITIHYNETRPWHSCPSIDFADTPFFNNWAHDGIDYCVEHELMNGVGNNLFNPNGTVSRGQLVTILYRMAGSPETEFASTFTDVAEGLWYSDAIEWAAANGVVNGVGNSKFAPDQSITREQIATILYRYHGSPAVSGNLNSFPDAGSVRDYAVNSMLWATQEGLINGVSSNGVTTLAPQNNATRAQIASIIMRYCKSLQTT